MEKYVTNFSRGCFSHWTASKAVMELVQNALDSDGEFSYSFSDDTLTLTNANIKVSNKLLMMGMSDKRGDDSKRGQFGVGSVQAMVVLTDLGINVVIDNNDVQWVPMFEYDDKFNEDIMVIHEYPMASPDSDFTVEINGLSEDDIDEIKQRCLEFQDREVLFSTEYGDVIENLDGETGEVFCGDLYVCQNTQFAYSYNFKPKVIKLSQDRDAVSQWDMQSLTAKLVMATGDDDFIKEAMRTGRIDTQLVKYGYAITPSSVDNSFAEEFLEEHGTVVVTDDYTEHDRNVKLGNKSVYNPNSSVVHSIQQSDLYQEAISQLEVVEKEGFVSLMEKFLDDVEYIIERSNDSHQDTEKLLAEIRERVYNEDFE
jgi:hypothetical protein